MKNKPDADGWMKVVHAHECNFEDWDDEKEYPMCPHCKIDYSECGCPGPHQEDIFEYKMREGIIYARKLKHEQTSKQNY